MKRWNAWEMAKVLLLSLALWGVAAGFSLCVGSTGLFRYVAMRWEMVFMASLVGAALASAGVVYQAILRNPLADPYLLGASSGASLAVYAFGFGSISALAGIGQQGAAFGGAIIAVLVVLGLGQRRGRLEPLTLILIGVIVNAINGAGFLVLASLGQAQDISNPARVVNVMVGAMQTSLTLQTKITTATLFAIGWLLQWLISGQLAVASLDETEARSLGIRITRLRWIALLLASLVTAAAVSISGPIGFVGLVAPHLARLFVGPDTRKLLPVATAIGAGLLCLADAASRMMGGQLPVGVFTALLGGPFFLFLLYRSRKA